MRDRSQLVLSNSPTHPGEKLREAIAVKGWTQDELAAVTGRSRPLINEIIAGKRGITAEMAISLSAAIGPSPEYWLQLENGFRLSQARSDAADVQRRAKVFEMAPVTEMQKRGWLRDGRDINTLESDLRSFFGVQSLDEEPRFSVLPRKSDAIEPLTIVQRAWCFRARQLAAAVHAEPFKPGLLMNCKKRLRELAAFPDEAKNVARVLAGHGIRFVIVEPLVNGKMDGAAFWLSPLKPVIAMSVRRDQIDRFWFVLFHEFAHIQNGDVASVDADLVGESAPIFSARSEIEQRADEDASATLVPPGNLNSFILRVGPLYSKIRINQFAHRMKIHPGIVLGQLQHRGELGWNAIPELLVKVRAFVTSTALTDGWGRMFSPGVSYEVKGRHGRTE